MRLQRFFWFVNRFMIHMLLIVLSAVIIAALTYEKWLFSLFGGILFLFVLYKWLIRLKIHKNSVVVRNGRVFFFVPNTTERDRADFATRGQKIIHLPEYQLLDMPFKVELFFPGREGSVCSCRLSLHLAYSMQPAAWQRAYDSFVEHGEQLPQEVKRLLLKSCDLLKLQPAAIPGEDAIREYLVPVISHLNIGLETVGLEVMEVQCSFTEGLTLARYLAVDQQYFENRSTGTAFEWQVRDDEGGQGSPGALIGVDGSVIR
jgi:hypothetical protein